ncbi:MAG: ABC transporter permease [Prevotellaceae bacterium]|nr:ABC transporter permease [Prevotella sp.]MDD7256898.1 ABC transporter permease [Prevotellaceae bacterium]MDY6129840.1 ABC transporter permease [Prevotella sp.]
MEQNEGFFHKINEGIHDMCYIWAKEMKSTVRDEGVLIFFILVPLLYPLLYSWIYNNEVVHEVPVAVVDMSNTQLSRQFIRTYDASPETKVAFRCNDLSEAKNLVEKQVVNGIIYLPEDFATNIYRMQQSHISIFCDMSLLITYKAIYLTATSVAAGLNSKIQIAAGGNYTTREDEIATQPIVHEAVQIFNPTGGYGSFIIPAVLMLIIQQTLVLGIGLSAGTARENNRYQDLIPISRHYNGLFRIVFGKTLCYFMIYAVMAAYLALVVPKLFHFTSLPDGRQLAGFMLPYLLACIFFGMFVSCIVRYRENVMLLVVFTSIPLLFLSGASWPQSSISGAWQGVSWLFPSTFGVRGYVRINSMGATLQDVQSEYQALWIQVVVYFFATCAVYRYQLIHTRRHAMERLNAIKTKAEEIKARRKMETEA